MKFQVTFDDFTKSIYDSLEEAREGILDAHANGATTVRVVEIDPDGNEGREYGCSWNVSLEPQD